MEMVFTCHGSSLPQFCSAVRTAYSSPPQHGTSMRAALERSGKNVPFEVAVISTKGALLERR